jgi:hypothetical protein
MVVLEEEEEEEEERSQVERGGVVEMRSALRLAKSFAFGKVRAVGEVNLLSKVRAKVRLGMRR